MLSTGVERDENKQTTNKQTAEYRGDGAISLSPYNTILHDIFLIIAQIIVVAYFHMHAIVTHTIITKIYKNVLNSFCNILKDCTFIFNLVILILL